MHFQLLQTVADSLGYSYDRILILVVIFSSIPLGLINYLFKNPTLRIWYGLITGLFLSYTLYGIGFIHSLLGALFTYFFIHFYGRKRTAFWVFITTFLHLTSVQIWRLIYHYGEWSADDITTIYMMTICKFSSMAFSYEDGAKKDEEIKNSHWRQYKIVEKPTLLEVLSYTFYFPSSTMGPVFEFKDFQDFVNLTGCYKRLPKGMAMIYGLCEYICGLLLTVVYVLIDTNFPLDFVGKKEYGEFNIIKKYIYLTIAMFGARCKFYLAWMQNNGGMIFCGLAYGERPWIKEEAAKEKNQKIVPKGLLEFEGDGYLYSFQKGNFGNALICEFGLNPKTKITAWNESVSIWLKYSLFLRLINVENKWIRQNKNASMITFMTSALWHGVYPTYFITFILFFIYQTINEPIDKSGFYVKLYSTKNYFLFFLMWMFTQFMVNSLGAIIFNLDFSLCVQFLKNIKFITIIFLVIMYIITLNIKLPKKNKEVKNNSKEGENDKKKSS